MIILSIIRLFELPVLLSFYLPHVPLWVCGVFYLQIEKSYQLSAVSEGQ